MKHGYEEALGRPERVCLPNRVNAALKNVVKEISTAIRRLALALLLAITAAGAAHAAEVMVIVDGSGSSAGQIGGVAKIDIARGALREVLADSPENLSIGLVAYGHRNEDACNDVELLAEPGAPDAFLAAADGIRSLGRSPIAAAVETAAGAVTDPDGAATIILITDNADNCAPEPCETIAGIAERMPNLVISVVGIAVPEDEVADIACFADLTGGTFLRTENAAGFNDALDQVMRAAWGPPPPPPPTATIAFPFDVVQNAPFEVTYEGPAAPGDTMRIAWVGSPPGDYIAAAAIPANGDPVEMTAPTQLGAYELRYWHAALDRVLARMPLPVAAIAPEINAPASVQRGADIEITWAVDAKGGETIEIADPTAAPGSAGIVAEAIRTERSMVLTAPGAPGIYEVRLVAPLPDNAGPELRVGDRARILAARALEVTEADIAMTLAEPAIAGALLRVQWSGPGGRFDEIHLAATGARAGDWIAAAAASGDTARLRAPAAAGRYELRYWSAAAVDVIATVPIEIGQPTASLSAPTEIRGGSTFELEWSGPGNSGDAIIVVDAAGETIDSVRVPLFGSVLAFDAPVLAGPYTIAYLPAGAEEPLAAADIAVTDPDASVSTAGSVDAGEAMTIRWDGPRGRFDELRLVGPGEDGGLIRAERLTDGTVTWTAPEEPGEYQVQYWSGGGVVLATAIVEVACSQCEPPAPEPMEEPELRLSPAPAEPAG